MKPALKGVLIGGAIGFIVFILLIRIYGGIPESGYAVAPIIIFGLFGSLICIILGIIIYVEGFKSFLLTVVFIILPWLVIILIVNNDERNRYFFILRNTAAACCGDKAISL